MSTLTDNQHTPAPAVPASAAPGDGARPSITYQPALDGIRALAVIGVLLFHNGFSWMTGGFLGVSTFFTLSGFLITSLLLVEREAHGAIALRPFWGRRFRRLLPAALACLVLVLAFGAVFGSNAQQANLRGDVLGSLFYVANWHFVLEGTSYADIFSGGAESPAQHFWSLAIEEQFYLLFPLLVFAATRLLRPGRARLALVLGTLWVASLAANMGYFASGWSLDRIYYGTDTRAAELLTGALLALALCGRNTIGDRRVRTMAILSGPSVLALMVLLWSFTTVTTQWLHYGGFALYSLLSALLITAAVQPTGPVRAALSSRPLRWIGMVSYGAYLYHWPVFLALRDHTSLGQWPRLVLGCAITFGVAGLSNRFLEQPIRAGRWPSPAQVRVVFPAAAAVVAVLALVVTAGYRTSVGFDRDVLRGGDGSTVAGAPRVAFYGDSTMLSLVYGLGPFLDSRSDLVRAGGEADLGCGIGRGGARQYFAVPPAEVDADCWLGPWTASLPTIDPDVAVVLAGPWDITDRWLPGEVPGQDPPRYPGDPVYDEYLLQELLAATDLLASRGAKVIWLTSPQIELGMVDGELPSITVGRVYVDSQGAVHYVASDPARTRRFNELLGEVAQQRPDTVAVIDLAGYLATLPTGPVAPDLRPDGVHFSRDGGAQAVVEQWLGDELVRAIVAFRLLPEGTASSMPDTIGQR